MKFTYISLVLVLMVLLSCNSKNNSETKNNKNLSSKHTVIKDAGEVSSYFSSKVEELAFCNSVIFINKLVLYTVDENVYGFYGFVAQGSPTEDYIVGKKKGNEIVAKKYSLIDGTVSPEFKLTILPKSVTTLSPNEKVTIPLDKIDFFEDQTLTIYQFPNIKSKVTVSDYDL